jgi:hypothetical protein
VFGAEAVAVDDLADGLNRDSASGESLDVLAAEAADGGDVDLPAAGAVIPGEAWPLLGVAFVGSGR